MTVFDIAALLIAAVFVIIGFWRGFVKSSLRLAALLASFVLARLFGGAVGRMLVPELVKSDRLSEQTLQKINSSLASVIGTVLVFAVLLIVLRLIARLIAKITVKSFGGKAIDKLLGALLGLVFAVAAIYSLAFVVDLVAIALSLIAPSVDIYSLIENSVIFKYFF